MKTNYNRPKVIAEIGCNHMGDMDTAKELILLAKSNGANAASHKANTPVPFAMFLPVLNHFNKFADLVLAALDKIRISDISPIQTKQTPLYFSFPKAKDWREFRARGGKFI